MLRRDRRGRRGGHVHVWRRLDPGGRDEARRGCPERAGRLGRREGGVVNHLEAMVHIERYGAEPCRACGHTVPSLVCTAPGCLLLSDLQEYEVEDDVEDIAARIVRDREVN